MDKTKTVGTSRNKTGTAGAKRNDRENTGTSRAKQGLSWAKQGKQRSLIIPKFPCLVPAWFVPVKNTTKIIKTEETRLYDKQLDQKWKKIFQQIGQRGFVWGEGWCRVVTENVCINRESTLSHSAHPFNKTTPIRCC